MKEPTFNKSYTNIRQQMYDTALTSEYFDLASFNAAEQSGDTKRADIYLNIANMTKGLTSPEFNKDVFDMFSGDYEFQMSYLHNKLLQDPNEIKNGVNVYQVTNDYLNARIEQKEREVWYNNLNGLEKFSVDLGLLLGDIGNTLYGIIDSVGDAVILLGAASADVLTGGAFHEQISEGSKKAITTDWSRTDEIARELDKYKSVSRLSTGWFGKTIDEITVGIANMAPLLIPGVGSLVYAGTMLGGAAEEAVTKNPDIDLFDLTLYSAAVTGVEYGTEWLSGKIFGGMDFVGSKMFGTSTRQAKNWFTYSLSNFMSEAFEEGISEIADSILNIAFVDPYAEVASFQEVLHAALIGGAIGFSMAGLGVAFTRNGAIDTKTGQFIKNYKAAMNQWIDGDGNIYNNESDARKSGRKDVRQRYNEGDLTKLSKIETMNMASQLGNAIQYMNTDPLEDFYTKYQRDNPNLTIEQVQVEHPEEYAKALAESKDSAKVIADAAAMLATVYEQAGAKGFIKATDILKSTRETQSRLIKNAVEYTPSKVLKYRALEKAIMSKFPNTTFKVNENLTAAQIRLQDTVRSNYGLDVVFGDYGNYNGNAASTSFAVSENTVVLDNKYYEKLSDRTIAEKFAKNALIESLQMSSGILSAENIKNLNKILDKTKHTGYNDSTLQDSLDLSKSVEELKNTDVEKLSEQELRKYAELQKNTLAQLLMFDELTISEVFIGAPKTFKQMWQWLTKQGNFLKNAIKTPINKMKYNYVLKAQRKYENSMAKKSPNINFMRAAANDVGADDEALKRMERIFDPNSKRKDFVHWNYLPITENSNLKDYLKINDKLFELTNNKFTFKDAFNPAIYSEKVLEDYKLMDFSNDKTFKYNLQDYLINNFGFVIDDVHEQFVRVTQFDEHTSDVFTLNLMSVLDGTMTLDDLQFEHPSVGSIFNDEFNSNVYSRETGDNLYNYQLIFQPVNRLDAGEKYGKTIVNNTEKTVVVFIDPNSKNLQNELIQAEHTIYHETQHIIADWTNMYQGADRKVLSDAMRSEPKQDKIKNLYEMLNDDKFVQSDEQYAILAEQIYSLLGGEWLAESERLKYDKSTSKKVYDKLNVFGQTDYLDIQYRPNGVGTDLIIKGYGFYSNIKIELFTNKATTFSAERNTPITNIQGNITDEFKAIQHEQSYKNKTKDMLNETPTSDVYVTGVGDAKASNEAIHALYPKNKYATTIEYADQVLNEGLMYSVVYDELTKGQQIDRNQSHTFEEITQFVNSELNNKYSTERTALDEKYKNVKKDSKEYSDYLRALKSLDNKFSKTFNDYETIVKEAIDRGFLKRTDILRDDFDYSINAVRKLRNDGKIPMERGKSVGLNTISFSQLDFNSNVKGEEGRSFEETVADESDDFAKLEEESGLTSEGASQIITALKSKLDKPSGFDLIDNIYKEANDDNKAGLQMKQLLNKQGLMSKEEFEKTATEKINQIKNKYGERLTEQENKRVNYDVSKIDNPEKFRRYLKALDEILENHKNDVQNIVEKPTIEDAFKRVQEESRREVADKNWGIKNKEIDETVRTRLSRVLEEKIDSDRSRYNDNSRLLKLTNKENTFEIYENINPNTFRDCFEITRAYLKYGELVDLHDVKTTEEHGVGYEECECYLSKDGLSGFAITPDGDLISVFNGSDKRGFLRAISPIIKEKVKTLDCFISYKQDLQDIYSKVFGFKTASIMDYNMKYDHDKIAETHNKPKVAFMVNTDADVITKKFTKDQYNEAKAYQEMYAKGEQPVVEKPTTVETIETATKSQPSTLGEAIVALMESDEIKTRMSEVQNVGESNQELKSVSKDIWRNHADIFAGINDSNYETIRDTIEKSGNRTALIEFDYYCREFKGRFNKETTKLIDANAQKVLHESGQVLSTQSHTLYNAKPINDIVNSLGNDGYTVDVDDSVIAEYDERLANKDKHIADLEQQIKDLEQQLQNKDLNALEKADISDELQKVAEEKYVFENGSNIDLMDWLLNNVDAPTIAEVFAKQTEIQKSFLDKLIAFAERAQIEGKDVGFYLKSKETGDIKAFPKTREFLAKWLKKARTYRMWAMLSSPTTWVRNWVGNTGMKSLDVVTNAFEKMLSKRFFADIDYSQELKTLSKKQERLKTLETRLDTSLKNNAEYTMLLKNIETLEQTIKDTEKSIKQEKNKIVENNGQVSENLKALNTALSTQKEELNNLQTQEKNFAAQSPKLKALYDQVTKLRKEVHKTEFDLQQLKYQETRAGKTVYNHVAKQFAPYILNQLIRREGSKYDETGGKTGALKQLERNIEYQSANTLKKLLIKSQDLTRYGLETGIFGDERMLKNAIVKNFSNMVASNTDYLLASIQIEYDALSKKSKLSETETARLSVLKKALKTQEVTAIVDAMNETETTRFFNSARDRAAEQYFKNGNWLSRTLSDLAKKSPVFGEIMSWVIPFPKVAANILTMAYKYSPFGFVSTLVQWSKYKQKQNVNYTGPITGFEKADIIRSASQATTGTFMLIAGALMAALGVIDIDDDDYLGPALKVGNFMRISLKDLAPSMTTFSTAAALMYSWKNHKSGVEEALNNLYDNTLLGNVDNIFRYGGLTKFAENLPISLTGQYVPAVLKLINNTVFKTPQKDKSGNLLEKTWKTLAASIPGLSATVPNKINPYTGEPMYASGSENWFLNFLAKASPITVKYTYGKSALEKEAERLGSGTTGASGSFTINGTNYTVKNKESIAKFRANYLESEFDKIQSGKTLVTVKDEKSGKMITTSYSKLTDAQKQNVLTSLYSKASNASKIEYWTKSGNKYVATTTEEYQKLKKTVTTPSKIIFNKNWSKSKFVEG